MRRPTPGESAPDFGHEARQHEVIVDRFKHLVMTKEREDEIRPEDRVMLREPDIVREDRADPRIDVGPKVRGARRYDVIRDFVEAGKDGWSKDHLIAAEHYRDACAIVAGARGQFNETGVRAGFSSGHGPTEAQVKALVHIKAAKMALGVVRFSIFAWCVENYGSVNSYARRYRIRNGTAVEWLKDRLGVLIEHYREIGRML